MSVILELTDAEAERVARKYAVLAESNGPDQGIYDKLNLAIGRSGQSSDRIPDPGLTREEAMCLIDEPSEFPELTSMTNYRAKFDAAVAKLRAALTEGEEA